MTEPTPTKVVEIVIGLNHRDNFNFMNFLDPKHPTPLKLDLSERCELFFRLSDELVTAGWRFQPRPIKVNDDYGVNFSSYMWVTTGPKGKAIPAHTGFKIIYECARMGIYTYSLFMLDSLLQKITLDPDVENGTGQVP
ncbi:hypothetical protein [Caulobacter segnis]|uniref:hypothetical protein n=1 Tax=Caulobacter segnis TaxID=88688 RepID=UPI002856674E|nr:hypothetical protein [Caulobacter segnis]MDR6624299.1 hypothetical protein [Caulobacter segnis]